MYILGINGKIDERIALNGDTILNTVQNYKYIGVYFDDFLTFDEIQRVSVLSESASRALGGIIAKFKNIGYRTYTKMYEAAVVPVSDYAPGVRGFKDRNLLNNVHKLCNTIYSGCRPT